MIKEHLSHSLFNLFMRLKKLLRNFLTKAVENLGMKFISRRMAKISTALNSLKVRPFLPSNVNSVVLRSFLLPSGMTYDEVHKSLKTEGFIIYAGQSQYRDKLFRISLMGDLSTKNLSDLELALGKTFR